MLVLWSPISQNLSLIRVVICPYQNGQWDVKFRIDDEKKGHNGGCENGDYVDKGNEKSVQRSSIKKIKKQEEI